jgi:hypothetical protein
MELEILQDLITGVGFPIAVTVYLLYERARRDQTLTRAIENNTVAVQQLHEIVRRECK